MFNLDTTHWYSQYTSDKIIGGAVDQQDDSVMDNVIVSCSVGDEEALVGKASHCSGSRRRQSVRQMSLTTRRQFEQTLSTYVQVAELYSIKALPKSI